MNVCVSTVLWCPGQQRECVSLGSLGGVFAIMEPSILPSIIFTCTSLDHISSMEVVWPREVQVMIIFIVD